MIRRLRRFSQIEFNPFSKSAQSAKSADQSDADGSAGASPSRSPHAFSIVELIVVIAIIAVLMSLLLPALKRARQSAQIVACASNLRQVYFAFQSYLNDNRGTAFWRGADLDTDGMDWYAYGGREAGNKNLDQSDFFNRVVPRPLNRYVGGKIEMFRCPCDDNAPWTYDPNLTPYPADSQFDWVGNSYNFNANGYPLRPQPRHDGGLDEVKIGSVHDASNTVLFFDACLYWGYDWHYAHKGSIGFVDGHVIFNPMPAQEGEFHWDP